MKSVSKAYKTGMKQLMRNRSYVKVTFKNVDTSAASDGSWESNGALPYSEVSSLNDSTQYGKTIAALELNRWTLDGICNILPSGDVEDGFISSILSGNTGAFGTTPTLTREFEYDHAMSGLSISFDTRTGAWPIAGTIDIYHGGVVVDTIALANITSPVLIIEHGIEATDKIVMNFASGLPYRRVRVEEVLYGIMREYVNEEIASTSQSHDVDPLSRRLPSETFSFEIIDYEGKYDPDNPQGVYAYVAEHSPVAISFGYELADGSVEWVKPDKYTLNAKPSVKGAKVRFSAVGLIGGLSDMYYKSMMGSKSLYDMAVAVLEDANLPKTSEGNNPWVIHSSLSTMLTDAVLPIDTHMSCLQLIAHAACCRLYTDDDNVIHIEPFGVTLTGIYAGQFSDNGHESYSKWDSVDKGNSNNLAYTTLELNRWVLAIENNQRIVPDSNPEDVGYVSSQLSNGTGDYVAAPAFIRTFDLKHNLSLVNIRFTHGQEGWPHNIKVDYYEDNALVTTQEAVVDGAEVAVSCVDAVNINKIVVTALTGLPYERLRVDKVYYRTTDFSLDFTTIAESSQEVSKIDKLKNIEVYQYVYTPSATAVTQWEDTTDETNLHVEFAQPTTDVSISVTGGTLISSTIYGRAADLVLSAGTKHVIVSGKPMAESSVLFSTQVAATGETDTEINPLIMSDALRTALVTHVTAYLTMRNTYDVEYRGNPEIEVGDIIGMQTRYTDEMDALILTDEITFDGALHGKLKVKGLI